MKKLQLTYGYDDVTLVPAYSDLTSRSQADPKMHGYSLPIIASCMDTLGVDVMKAAHKGRIPFIAHRAFKSAEEQFNHFKLDILEECSSINWYSNVWFAVGSVQKYKEWINELYIRGVRQFCVDMAHGDSKTCIDTIKYIRELLDKKIIPDECCKLEILNQTPHIIAGNVATAEGFKRLQAAGADGIRIGVASGQICFTPDTLVRFVSKSGKVFTTPIKFIKEGDTVITKEGHARKVLKTFKNYYKGEIYIINKDVCATPTHKFYVYDTDTQEKLYKEIKDVDENRDQFITLTPMGEKYVKASIDIDEYNGDVYNIEVDQDHSYCVGKQWFCVSNCSTALNCFPENTLVNTLNGKKKISELQNGDLVLCHDGSYQNIISTTERKYEGEMIEINGQLSTPNHLYFVINNEDADKVDENNYLDYGYWIEAKNITKNHLLINLDE